MLKGSDRIIRIHFINKLIHFGVLINSLDLPKNRKSKIRWKSQERNVTKTRFIQAIIL